VSSFEEIDAALSRIDEKVREAMKKVSEAQGEVADAIVAATDVEGEQLEVLADASLNLGHCSSRLLVAQAVTAGQQFRVKRGQRGGE
jgi:hypothetical protein